MQRQRTRPQRRTIEEPANADRWLVSYADFITLLFAFFVVMYAISSVNEGKYRVLADTMVAAFNTPPKSMEPIQTGKPIEKISEDTRTAIGVPKPIRVEPPRPVQSHERMKLIADVIKNDLQPLIDKDLIKVTHNNLWVEVEINTSILFSVGSAQLEEEADTPLLKLAQVIKDLPNYVDVEGHTDNLPIKTPVYPTNWELSAARAASVVHLFAKQGVAPQRLSAIGYGEHRPAGDNNTIEGRRQNRRVKIVILADKNARRMSAIEGQESVATDPAIAEPIP